MRNPSSPLLPAARGLLDRTHTHTHARARARQASHSKAAAHSKARAHAAWTVYHLTLLCPAGLTASAAHYVENAERFRQDLAPVDDEGRGCRETL